jgi:transposase-like protein
MGIYNWVIRFSKEAVERVKDFKPDVGDEWIADETCLKVGGKNIWFWDIIDIKSRYLLASRLSDIRTTKEAALLMREASRRTGKIPKAIVTDKLAAYIDGIELVFGADTKHIQSKPFTDENSTNIIERFQGTLKDRTKIIRGFKNMDTARLLTEAWLVHYNFFKEHETLGNIPPAVAMGATPIKDWAEVVSKTKVIASPSIKPYNFKPYSFKSVIPVKKRPMRKVKHPKRKPQELKPKSYAQVIITSRAKR